LFSAANLQISTINATSWGATLTSNATTALLTIGNSSVSSTINGSNFSGTANNSSFLGGTAAASYALLSGAAFTGAVSGITTLAAGNTSITGFANVSTSVNSALLTVGTSFIANTTGAYHTGTVNAASHTVGTSFIANTTGAYHTGTVNAASLSVGTSFVANTTQVTIAAGVPLSANGGTGTAAQVLTSNGTTGSPYWSTVTSGTTYTFSTGLINTTGTITVNSAYIATISANNTTYLNGQLASYYTDIPTRLGYTPVQQGTGTGQGTNVVKIGWSNSVNGGASLRLSIDVTDFANTWPISVTGSAASATGSAATFTSTTQNSQFNSVGVGTAASTTAGEIRATNNISAYYSDERLKENITPISNALEKVRKISGVTFNSNDIAAEFGYTDKKTQVGVIAQEIEAVLPEIVVPAPFDIGQDDDGNEYSLSGENYKTVQYDKLVPLLIEAIKEQQNQIDELRKQVNDATSK
jgi:hypothetical protein